MSSSKSEKMLNVLTIIVLFSALLQGGLWAYRSFFLAPNMELPSNVKDWRGKPVPSLSNLKTASGTSLAIQTAKPKTLVAFLSTTCSACKTAKSTLEKLSLNTKSSMGFIGVFIEPIQSVQAYGAKYPTYLDTDQSLIKNMQVHGFPTFYLVKRGVIEKQWVGWSSEVSANLETEATKE